MLLSVVDTPLEGRAVGRAGLVAFVLLERPGIFTHPCHASHDACCRRNFMSHQIWRYCRVAEQ